MRYFVGFDSDYASFFTLGKLYSIHWDDGYRVSSEQEHAHRLTVALEVVKGSTTVEFPE